MSTHLDVASWPGTRETHVRSRHHCYQSEMNCCRKQQLFLNEIDGWEKLSPSVSSNEVKPCWTGFLFNPCPLPFPFDCPICGVSLPMNTIISRRECGGICTDGYHQIQTRQRAASVFGSSRVGVLKYGPIGCHPRVQLGLLVVSKNRGGWSTSQTFFWLWPHLANQLSITRVLFGRNRMFFLPVKDALGNGYL